MNVLCVVNGYPSEGQRFLCPFNKVQIDGLRKHTKLRVRLIKINKKKNGLRDYIRAFRLVSRTKWRYDVLHCFHGSTFLATFFAKKRPHAKILVSFLNNIELEYHERKHLNRVFLFATKILLRNKNVFTIIKNRRGLKEGERQFYLPNGIDMDLFQPICMEVAKQKLGLNTNFRYILFVSSKYTHRMQKRYELFKQVVEVLRARDESIRELVVSGVDQAEMRYFYSASELLLLTSIFEGSPNSVKEAIACDCPVVSSDVGDVREIVKNVPMCHVFEDEDPEFIADLCEKTILERQQKIKIADWVEKNGYDVKSRTQQLESIYQKITCDNK
jgi:teichuronic acid biosynthesis glycosyltransferase TuaC